MNRLLVVVAALLLIVPLKTTKAVAADKPEHFTSNAEVPHKQKKAEKLLAMMKSIGVYDSDVAEFVQKVDKNIKEGRLTLYQDRVAGGTLALRYNLQSSEYTKRLGLVYTPDNSRMEYSVHTNAVMFNCKFKF